MIINENWDEDKPFIIDGNKLRSCFNNLSTLDPSSTAVVTVLCTARNARIIKDLLPFNPQGQLKHNYCGTQANKDLNMIANPLILFNSMLYQHCQQNKTFVGANFKGALG